MQNADKAKSEPNTLIDRKQTDCHNAIWYRLTLLNGELVELLVSI